MFSKHIFRKVKQIIPKISDTELIALTSGTTSLDRQLFNGKIEYPKINKAPEVFKKEVDKLLHKYGDVQKIYPSDKSSEILEYIGKHKFLSFIISKEYGGTELSVSQASSILTKISSKNPALGVAIMVPNSLGPGELLQHYGNTKQKNKYLPGLADGTYIPCFGLTGPHNGSDATGTIDDGELICDITGNKLINITLDKRYITLGPVANLIGIAFNLKDTFDILETGKEGITVALIESNHAGLKQLTHHNPLDAGFPNGTLKGNIQIPIENIIGGEKNAGEGWKMLMECLAAGRGVSLPATANASSKTITYGVYNYALHRKQFKMPLIKMEAVQNKIVNMLFNTWIIQSSIEMMNTLLDNGEKPAVLSAIMKQQTTDRGREVINEGMDIYAGSAICKGDNNFIEKFYKSAPIGITVEGSNTLTKNLIIFAQGLNKSHPYIFPILSSILNDDVKEFNKNFKNIVNHTISLYIKSLNVTNFNLLEKQTIDFACLSNFIALKGGSLKSNQSLCGDMADIMSNLYLAHSVKFYEENYNVSKVLSNYCIDRLLNENKLIINRVIQNEPLYTRIFLQHLKQSYRPNMYDKNRELIKELKNNKNIIEHIKKDIYTDDFALSNLEKLNFLDKDSDEYKNLYERVISVGEFKNN